VFLLDPTIRGNWKAGEVIRGPGDGSSAAGFRADTLVGVRGQSLPKWGSGGRAPRSWTGFNDYKVTFGWIFF